MNTILEVLKAMLEGLGYTILDAATPSEAIRQAKKHSSQIHLLITDVVMPEMNGRDMSNNLTKLHPNIKLLFISGYTANLIARQGVIDKGVIDKGVQFIHKPFSKKEIATKGREVLDDRKQPNQKCISCSSISSYPWLIPIYIAEGRKTSVPA